MNPRLTLQAKLAHLLENNLRTEPTDALPSEYLHRCAVELEHQLAAAPMVEGIREFIACYPASRYVCSSAPDAEVHEQVSRLSLGQHLAAVYGSITPKSDALRAIARIAFKPASGLLRWLRGRLRGFVPGRRCVCRVAL